MSPKVTYFGDETVPSWIYKAYFPMVLLQGRIAHTDRLFKLHLLSAHLLWIIQYL